MKYLKPYEHTTEDEFSILSKEHQINDYVICEENINTSENLIEFLKNNIGQITSFLTTTSYVVKYDNTPNNLQEFFTKSNRLMRIEEIKYISKNKKDLLPYITANKYNL